MAHKEPHAQEAFNRHYPIWKKLGADIIVACPTDSQILLPEREVIQKLDVGKAAHTGPQSIIRIMAVMERLWQPQYDRMALFEYDAIAFDWPEMTAPIVAPVFRDDGSERPFKGTMFLHPPIFFRPDGLQRLLAQFQKMRVEDECSVWDRFVGYAIELAGIEVRGMLQEGLAFSHNTIHPDMFPALRYAVRNGAYAYHGIKSAEALQVVMEMNQVREAAALVRKHKGEITWKDE